MRPLRIGIIYDLLGSYPRRPGDPPDADAEYEPESTVEALERAVARLGHRPLRIGNAHQLLARAGKQDLPALDAALSIAEGHGSRNREAWAPVLVEMLEVPALGSDALTLSLTLDKVWAKNVAAAAGVPTPPYAVARSADEAASLALPAPFPLFVKPRWEGTAKGIGPRSRVEDREALARAVAAVVEGYGQPALVEAFVPGPEYTVTLVGNDPPRALPVVERALETSTGIGLHALERPLPSDTSEPAWHLPGGLDPERERALAELGLLAFDAFECRDFARADFRLDAEGRPLFLEMNPLPTFATDGTFAVLAEIEGRPLDALLAEVIEGGLRRLELLEEIGGRSARGGEGAGR